MTRLDDEEAEGTSGIRAPRTEEEVVVPSGSRAPRVEDGAVEPSGSRAPRVEDGAVERSGSRAPRVEECTSESPGNRAPNPGVTRPNHPETLTTTDLNPSYANTTTTITPRNQPQSRPSTGACPFSRRAQHTTSASTRLLISSLGFATPSSGSISPNLEAAIAFVRMSAGMRRPLRW